MPYHKYLYRIFVSGISSYLIEELGLDNSVRVYDLAGWDVENYSQSQLASSLVQAENITVAE